MSYFPHILLLPTPVFYTYIFSFNSLCIFSSLSVGHSLFSLSVQLILCLPKVLMDNYMDLNHEDRVVSYLPLSHIAAQLIDIHAPMKLGATTYFCQVMSYMHHCPDKEAFRSIEDYNHHLIFSLLITHCNPFVDSVKLLRFLRLIKISNFRKNDIKVLIRSSLFPPILHIKLSTCLPTYLSVCLPAFHFIITL